MNAPPFDATLRRMITAALREDIGRGDITSRACVAADAQGVGVLLAKAPGVLCGIDIAQRVFLAVDPAARIVIHVHDGARVRRGTLIARIHGNLRALLAAERTALNFLQQLSGVATKTRLFVDAVRGTRAVILDTRKTTPLYRALEKYAVRVGGARNHRSGLHDMMLIKDNHIAAAGGVAAALQRCLRRRGAKTLIEIETTSLAQVRDVLALDGVDRIMLDNFSLQEIKRAVRLIDGRIPIEVSGGVSLKNVRTIARTGVDFISVGAITHSAPALDISFELH